MSDPRFYQRARAHTSWEAMDRIDEEISDGERAEYEDAEADARDLETDSDRQADQIDLYRNEI